MVRAVIMIGGFAHSRRTVEALMTRSRHPPPIQTSEAIADQIAAPRFEFGSTGSSDAGFAAGACSRRR